MSLWQIVCITPRALWLLAKITKLRREEVNMIRLLWLDESGQDLTEYALLLVLIALVAVAGIRSVGFSISDAFSNAAANLTSNT